MIPRATISQTGDNYQISFNDHGLTLEELDRGLAEVIHSAKNIQSAALADILYQAPELSDLADKLVDISPRPCLQVVNVRVRYAGGGEGDNKAIQMQVPATYISDVATLLQQGGWDLETEDRGAFEIPEAQRIIDVCSTLPPRAYSPGTGLDRLIAKRQSLDHPIYHTLPNAGKLSDPKNLGLY